MYDQTWWRFNKIYRGWESSDLQYLKSCVNMMEDMIKIIRSILIYDLSNPNNEV